MVSPDVWWSRCLRSRHFLCPSSCFPVSLTVLSAWDCSLNSGCLLHVFGCCMTLKDGFLFPLALLGSLWLSSNDKDCSLALWLFDSPSDCSHHCSDFPGPHVCFLVSWDSTSALAYCLELQTVPAASTYSPGIGYLTLPVVTSIFVMFTLPTAFFLVSPAVFQHRGLLYTLDVAGSIKQQVGVAGCTGHTFQVDPFGCGC